MLVRTIILCTFQNLKSQFLFQLLLVKSPICVEQGLLHPCHRILLCYENVLLCLTTLCVNHLAF